MTFVPEDKKVYHFRQDYFISPDFILLDNSSQWVWMSLIELWDQKNPEWGTSDPAGQARWSLSFEKTTTGHLRWKAYGQKKAPMNSDIFVYYSDFPIPIGQWFTIDFYFERGEQGRFITKIKIDNFEKTIFDLTVPTIYAGHYMPLNYMQTCKFYVNKQAIYYVKNHGGTCDMYFDNIKIFKD